jgi:hypothetical protein
VVVDAKTLPLRELPIIAGGAVRCIDTLFHQYLSGAERIAVLMNSMGAVI